MDGFNHGDDVIDWCFRQDAVTEIKNMAGPSFGSAQDVGDAISDFFWRGQQRDRIEVALNSDIMFNRRPTFVEIYPPIQTDHVAAGGAHMF